MDRERHKRDLRENRENREKQASREAGKQGAFITNLLLSLKWMVFDHKVESVMFY